MSIDATVAPCKCDCACGEQATEAELMVRLEEVIEEYREKEGGLIPALQIAQTIFGYLPDPVVNRIAAGFNKTVSEVAGVISFYSFFTRNPRGKYLVRVCLGTACYVRGGKEVLEAIKKRLEIDVGETTEDRQFSLEVGRCFGACGMAPVVMVNDDTYQRVKPARINELIAQFITEEEPAAEGENK
ncbi:MAG: NAD(P)H-dependent oxidoreductase subunit E [Kiritimatiellae bacterium]|jgi:NADH-quinone oxidoreductase E subunit|nr:NAD(P)H-dependent oxidoreductase subunit E [Kiritimatiellia bacterium]